MQGTTVPVFSTSIDINFSIYDGHEDGNRFYGVHPIS